MNKRKEEDNRKNKEDYKNRKNKDYRESMNLPLHKKKEKRLLEEQRLQEQKEQICYQPAGIPKC